MKFKLHQPTISLLKELNGVELGPSAHNPYGVSCLNIAPAFDQEFWDTYQRTMGNEPVKIDYYGDAGLIPLSDSSTDFVLLSHVLEHVPDPIRAFIEWKRVLKVGGYIVMIIPLPSALTDVPGPITTLDQLKLAYKEKWLLSDEEHAIGGAGGHFWKFDMEVIKRLAGYLRRGIRGRKGIKLRLIMEENPDSKVGNGFFLAYKLEAK